MCAALRVRVFRLGFFKCGNRTCRGLGETDAICQRDQTRRKQGLFRDYAEQVLPYRTSHVASVLPVSVACAATLLCTPLSRLHARTAADPFTLCSGPWPPLPRSTHMQDRPANLSKQFAGDSQGTVVIIFHACPGNRRPGAWLKHHVVTLSQTNLESSFPRAPVALGGPASYGSYAVTKRIGKIDETLDLRGKSVLDVGCGNGCYTAELVRRAAYVCGIDIQMSHLKAFRESISRVQGAGENLPFSSEKFDVVTMIEVLEHTDSDKQVLKECFRVLKPAGRLVLFVPNKLYPFESHPCQLGTLSIGPNIPLVSWLPEVLRKHLCHARIYTRKRLFSMASATGFQDIQCGYIFPPLDSFPLPFKRTYRRATHLFENSPLACFGVSIYAIFQKPDATARNQLRS